ncbi:MAG: hypothetical protein AB2L14_36955 [Candidatus Xenobiia bacterium LiM19]
MASDLEKRFHKELIEGYYILKRECNYNATRFLQLVQEKGGLQAAKDLIRSSANSIPEGLSILWEHKRLDMSLEAMVLRERWRPLFTDEEREMARNTLRRIDPDILKKLNLPAG